MQDFGNKAVKVNSKGSVTAAICMTTILSAVLMFHTTIPTETAILCELKSNELGTYIDLAGNPGFDSAALDDPAPADIISKRAWNTKAFRGEKKGEINWRIYLNRVHFFDGGQWVDLNLLSYPAIEKRKYILTGKPPLQETVTRFRTDNYLLHKGINASINESKGITFSDAQNTEISGMAQAYIIDAGGNTLTGNYQILQKGQKLEIFATFDSSWLTNAQYPIIVDPDTNYLTSKADGDLTKDILGACSASIYTDTPSPGLTAVTTSVGQAKLGT